MADKNIASEIPLIKLIPALTAIDSRDYAQFMNLEVDFVLAYSADTWEKVLESRIKPALDENSKQWLLMQKNTSKDLEA